MTAPISYRKALLKATWVRLTRAVDSSMAVARSSMAMEMPSREATRSRLWRSPKRSMMPWKMYRSEGKFSSSLTILARPGRARRAAAASLNRLTEVESLTTTSPGWAPIRRAILSPMAWGASIQLSFQARIRRSPHWCSTASRRWAAVRLGKRPRELPSR